MVWEDIVALARTSGINFSVSSTVRNEPGSYHNSGQAADLVSSAGEMQRLAAWFEQNYTPQLLELIHSGGAGYFVKNGKRVDAAYYGSDTVSQHYNHVHVAMSQDGVNSARSGAGAVSVENAALDISNNNSGCAVPAMVGLLTVTGGASASIWEIVRIIHG